MKKSGNKVANDQVQDWTPEKFLDEYQKLVDKSGYKITVNPAWKLNDKGEYVTVLQASVGKA